MAGKGVTDTFADGISRLLKEIGGLRAYPDADDGLLDEIQGMVVQHVRTALQPQAQAPGGMPPGGNPLAGLLQGGGVPMTEAEMSRGPIPGMQTGEAAQALERQMSGQ